MKFADPAWILLLLVASRAAAATGELIIVDSSFAPMEQGSFVFSASAQCPWIDENHRAWPESGSCHDIDAWKALFPKKALLTKMIRLNRMSRSVDYVEWRAQLAAADRSALEAYQLQTHGTRSAWIAWEASGRRAPLLAVRNISAASAAPARSLEGRPLPGLQRYAGACRLVNWSEKQREGFRKGRGLQDYQERLARVLESRPSAQVVSLSLGYNKEWIRADAPDCDAQQVESEFAALVDSWRALLRRFPDRLFVAAAGNEGRDLSKAPQAAAELWALLASEPNLLVVGALDVDNRPLAVSNFGVQGMTWALGIQVPLRAPLPGEKMGQDAEGFGTSSAAPMVAGRAWALLSENPKLILRELRKRLDRQPAH